MHALIRYTLKAGEQVQHLEKVREMYKELAQLSPSGLEYSTYLMADGVSFVEFFRSDSGPAPLAASPAFRSLRSTLDARCELPPTFVEMRKVGSYGSGASTDTTAATVGQGTA